MALTYKAGNNIQGLSSDTKPTTNLPAGYKFLETDTRDTYTWDGTTWTLSYLNYFGTKEGWYQPNSATTAIGGLWNGISAAITVGSQTGAALTYDSTDGLSFKYIAGATINSLHGTRVTTHCNRSFAPRVEFRLKLGQTTNCRVFFGYRGTSNAPTSGADPLASMNGVMYGLDTGVDANWHIYQNDATGTDSTTIANVAAGGTTTKYFGLRASGSVFQYSYDRGAWTNVSTKIPASTSILGVQWWIENLDGNVQNFQVYYVKHRQNM